MTNLHGYGYSCLLFCALYGEYLSKNHIIIPVIVKEASILSQTSNRSTVMNLNSEVLRTGFLVTETNSFSIILKILQ